MRTGLRKLNSFLQGARNEAYSLVYAMPMDLLLVQGPLLRMLWEEEMKPICFDCKLFYRMKKSGVYFTEGMPRGTEDSQTTRWVPYKIWSGDLWKCKGCGHELISGVGFSPISVQHEKDFKETREAFGADKININDC
jgi:hypothetical protein